MLLRMKSDDHFQVDWRTVKNTGKITNINNMVTSKIASVTYDITDDVPSSS